MRVIASTGTVGNFSDEAFLRRGVARPAALRRGVVVVFLLRTRVACAKTIFLPVGATLLYHLNDGRTGHCEIETALTETNQWPNH